MKPIRFRAVAASAFAMGMLLLAGCIRITVAPAATPTPGGTPAPAASATPTNAPETASPTAALSVTPTISPAATPTVTPTAAPVATPTPTPAGPRMYSSYADLVSYDPDTGVAQFDYFDMLRGDDAVDFLVEHEGYTEAAAQALVDDFADSEYVKKNTNPQLRAVDLGGVSLKLMYQPSGDPVDDATPVPSSLSDFNAIYGIDPSLLTDTYFYYIHVTNGHVSLVEQVYWP